MSLRPFAIQQCRCRLRWQSILTSYYFYLLYHFPILTTVSTVFLSSLNLDEWELSNSGSYVLFMEIVSFMGTITPKTEQRCYILTGYLLQLPKQAIVPSYY